MKSWEFKLDPKVLQPELLGQANVPKPLHGINPRTIMGKAAWTAFRRSILAKQNYCSACGIENVPFDLHEDYKTDYNKKYAKIEKYVLLCKDCHSFIHSGLLRVLTAESKDYQKAIRILEKGFKICADNNVSVFEGTYILAKDLKMDVSKVTWYRAKRYTFDGWYLEYNGVTYPGISEKQWKTKYKS